MLYIVDGLWLYVGPIPRPCPYISQSMVLGIFLAA
jgi:hypothetical protein